MLLKATDLNVYYGAIHAIKGVSFEVDEGEIVTLIGANGAGKTTAIRHLTGVYRPDSGSVTLEGAPIDENLAAKERICCVADEPFYFPGASLEEMKNFYAGLYPKFDGKRFDELQDVFRLRRKAPLRRFSKGMQKQACFHLALCTHADVLILDEPTNYLDVEHIEWLTKFLQNYEHAFILISHDIPFLNKVVNVIYHLENCELTRYSGDYDKFQEMYAIYQSQKAAAYERQQQEVAKLEDFIARNKARVATTNMAKSRQRKLDKMEMIEKPREKLKPTFKFTEARTPSRFIVEAKDLVLGYDSPLTRPVTFNLERGQKIAIRGVNGLGKTTLLKTILGIIPPVSGKVELGEFLEPGYFEQEEREKNENTALDDVWNEYPGLTNYEVRAALAGCGLTNEHITSKVFVLSGGEAAKVRLCKLMLKDVNWLVLDEPTNHLDVDAKDELKRALKEFKGSVLLVSHEPEFYEDWVDKVWNIEDWTTKII